VVIRISSERNQCLISFELVNRCLSSPWAPSPKRIFMLDYVIRFGKNLVVIRVLVRA
jgi:hypothetical protein